jgi:hypothetical protein
MVFSFVPIILRFYHRNRIMSTPVLEVSGLLVLFIALHVLVIALVALLERVRKAMAGAKDVVVGVYRATIVAVGGAPVVGPTMASTVF